MGRMAAVRPAAGSGSFPGLAATLLLSVALTLLMAWPVVRSPRTMLFGRELAGRHHDPFTVMQQFAAGGAPAPFRQPLTDDVGVWLARGVGPVAAYNLLVLASFPLTSLATYLLAYYLIGSASGALVAALAFTFNPWRMAQASYHVHIVQTHWMILYLLALFAAIDRPTAWRGALLIMAVACLTLSNDYGGLIGAVITPVALPAYWLSHGRDLKWRGLILPVVCLVAAVVGALAVILWSAPALLTAPERFAFSIDDLGRYGAQWWAYLIPPVDHPLFGRISRGALGEWRFSPGILELQLAPGWALTALALFATALAGLGVSAPDRTARVMLAVAAIGAWSFVASLAPPSPGCLPTSLTPSCLVYRVLPMFRGYARIGMVTSLSIALLAGYAIARFRQERTGWFGAPASRWLVAGALALVVIEAWPFPGRARDVLPTAAHRWLSERAEPVRALDCTPWTLADASLGWLMGKSITAVTSPFEGCDEPELVHKLAALGFTHVITRTSEQASWEPELPPAGLQSAIAFPDSRVYAVVASRPALVVMGIRGFWNWETHDGDRWRWMGQEGAWTVFNTTPGDVAVTLNLDLQSFADTRHLTVELDTRPLRTLEVVVDRREYPLGPLTLPPGQHVVQFRSVEPAACPADLVGTQDRRALTVALHSWRWSAS
jgi:hypothetical protein